MYRNPEIDTSPFDQAITERLESWPDDPTGEDTTPDREDGPYRLTVTFTADDILHAQLLATFMVMALRDRGVAYDAVVDGPVEVES